VAERHVRIPRESTSKTAGPPEPPSRLSPQRPPGDKHFEVLAIKTESSIMKLMGLGLQANVFSHEVNKVVAPFAHYKGAIRVHRIAVIPRWMKVFDP